MADASASSPGVAPAAAAAAAPPAPDPMKEALERAQKAAEDARRETAQMRDIASKAVSAYSSNLNARAPEEPAKPAPDFDLPEDADPKTIARAVEKRAAELVEERLKAYNSTIESRYNADRAADMRYREALEYERASRSLPKFASYEDKVKAYMANVPEHLRATPGAWQEAYKSILGQEALERMAQEEARGAELGSVGARSAAGSAPTQTALSAEDREWMAKKFDLELSDKEVEALSGKVVTITDYRKRMAQ